MCAKPKTNTGTAGVSIFSGITFQYNHIIIKYLADITPSLDSCFIRYYIAEKHTKIAMASSALYDNHRMHHTK